jgi:hypothetical protein
LERADTQILLAFSQHRGVDDDAQQLRQGIEPFARDLLQQLVG